MKNKKVCRNCQHLVVEHNDPNPLCRNSSFDIIETNTNRAGEVLSESKTTTLQFSILHPNENFCCVNYHDKT
jgi:hypothetical protein